MKIKYLKCSPGGNITALVITNIQSKNYADVARSIIEKDEEVEQVGYITSPKIHKDADARLQMAGDEFCGNATRSLGWILYKQGVGHKYDKIQIVRLEVSGTDKLLDVKIDDSGYVTVDMPIKKAGTAVHEEEIKLNDENIHVRVVELDGITHVLIPRLSNLKISKKVAEEVLQQLNLIEKEASGVIFYEHIEDGKYNIKPIVWVRDVKTLIEETACASGTVALALAEARRLNKSITLEIIQPSRGIILVHITIKNGQAIKAWIKGPVEIIGEYEINYEME